VVMVVVGIGGVVVRVGGRGVIGGCGRGRIDG